MRNPIILCPTPFSFDENKKKVSVYYTFDSDSVVVGVFVLILGTMPSPLRTNTIQYINGIVT